MSVAAKICGLSTEAAVRAAIAGGAVYLGFNFYLPSPRAVTAAKAARLCATIPAGIARVGIFVDADDDTIRAVLAEAPIDVLQFHGHESPERVAEARLRFARPVMKAVAIAAPEGCAAGRQWPRLRLGADRRPILPPPVDAVGWLDRRTVA